MAIIFKCVKSINDQHDRKEKYDAYDERINALDKKIENLDQRVQLEIEQASCIANKAITDIQDKTDKKLEEMRTEINAQFQQINSELCMLSYCVGATLDGLKQLDCNGKVSEAKEKMDKHLNQQAHGEI